MDLINIFWFRRDLRLEDNTGLFQSLQTEHPTLPLFIFDTNILDKLEKKDARVEFILAQIDRLQNELKTLGSSLLVKVGKPEIIFKNLISEYDVKKVFINHDYEPYAIQRDEKIKSLVTKNKIEFSSFKDQVIFEKNEILNDSGLPYKVYTSYKNKWKATISPEHLSSYNTRKHFGHFLKTKPFSIPALSDLGFQSSGIAIPVKKINKEQLKNYDKVRDYPELNQTSMLGIHLRFGTISVREAVKEAFNINETWLNELIWREFFMLLLYHFPHITDSPFNTKYKFVNWRHDEKDFTKWCEGKTGYPLVDAGMRQLNATGFMHNRVRMVTASFLTKHLFIDWRWGEAYFAKKLLDYELSSNNGNWQWAAGTGADAQPYFRIFNPALQQQKFDKDFKYIKKWVPEYGTDNYPVPMIDHKKATERVKEGFNKALNN
jgi:deoxyribodipyrimidine photo-lyase